MASPLSVLSGIVAHAALPEPPTFSDNYYIGQQVFLALDKGGAHFAPDGGMCCSKISDSSCSFEVISQGSDLYNYGDMQLTSTGTVVSNYTTLPTEQYGRQYALKPAAAGSSYKYECAVYCPLSSSYFNVIAIGDGRKQDPVSFMGNETVNNGAPYNETKLTSRFHWDTELIGRTFERTDAWVDYSGAAPSPFKSMQSAPIGPAGSDLFRSNVSFIDYTPMSASDLAAYFDVDPASYVKCERADSCQEDDAFHTKPWPHGLAAHQMSKIARSEHARSVGSRTPPNGASTARALGTAADPPQGPSDYVAFVDRFSLAADGPVVEGPTDLCCTRSSVGQCEVGLSHRRGLVYHDLTNQRLRSEDAISGQTVIDFLHDPSMPTISMLINVTEGVETCQEWCPLSAAERLVPFAPWTSADTEVRDLGKAMIDGLVTELYEWQQGLVHLGVYSDFHLYATVPAAAASKNVTLTPVLLTEVVTLLGQVGMTTNTSYSNVTMGTPPAAKFTIARGPQEGCPQSANCGSATWQQHRLTMKLFKTHAMFAPQQAKR